ncbi:hypothetical protein [Alteromonas sp. 14N.309.X.WAT.G.H12]|uniref:hypothetical protein n=1 Tax=Alteromonas sp. 14N.309.X.WAT.G.H12 TaxID=3120824 RepID=UPI002FCFADE3
MFSLRKGIFLTVSIMFSPGLFADDSSVLGDRENVLECSYSEVVAYMDLPDPSRKVMNDYDAWTDAYKSTELVKSESDPLVCLSVLYGDLSAIGDQLEMATDSLMSMQLPGMDEILSLLSDQLLESICSRVEVIKDTGTEAIIAGIDTFREQAEKTVKERYGADAMESYVTDAVIPPEFEDAGLLYRNGKIDSSQFTKNIKSRWEDELDELRDDIVGTD